ncbi:MAG: GNAT family N-acetyltransferase [Alphaproteobacteria bacterium]
MRPGPVTLEGRHVRLEPLAHRHAEDLLAAAQDPGIWLYMPKPMPRTLADIRAFIDDALKLQDGGTVLPFAQIDRASGRAFGSTRYMDIRAADDGLEIGWTWLGTAYQRTVLNTEAKYLLLSHAFDALGAIRVQLKTDLRNVRSQTAIARLGAVREGVLRNHMRMWDGYIRDSVYFSILDREWPAVRDGLLAKLAK